MRNTPPFLHVIAWWARRESDPVDRLRFLRRARRPRHANHAWLLVSLSAVLLLTTKPAVPRIPTPPARPRIVPTSIRVEPPANIWLVEKTNAFETYSNGLRIDNRFSVANIRRSYLSFPVARLRDARGELRSVPAGIVFHTTESLQIPFEADENAELERVGDSLLHYVKTKRAYNFVIDRFGRVYRIVPESDAANHAGYSVWADDERVYLNLNESFLAVAFETRTSPGQSEATVNPAQIHSAAMLTGMLRARYGIQGSDCVTHAQVSVNASSLRIGSHFDWASSFPFEQLGLPDNYTLPLPAVSLFGLGYDSAFARQGGERLYREAQLAEEVLTDHASAEGMSASDYRKTLQREYRAKLALVRGKSRRAESDE